MCHILAHVGLYLCIINEIITLKTLCIMATFIFIGIFVAIIKAFNMIEKTCTNEISNK